MLFESLCGKTQNSVSSESFPGHVGIVDCRKVRKMDRLNMSLDQLIEKNQDQKKSTFSHKKPQGNNNRHRDNKPKFGAAPRRQQNDDRDDRNNEPYVRRPVEVRQPLIYRPVKILSAQEIQQPRVTPSSASTGSVFARLGKPHASGTYVVFSNLKKSVEGSDLEELCGAVGEVKEVEKSGTGSARVLFARRSDAVTCVSKFNGLTLDGLVMVVALAEDAESVKPKSIFDRLAPKNVKEGVFGTAIAGSDDDEEMQEETVDLGRGRGRASSREPVFQVTLDGAAKMFHGNDRERDNNHHRGGFVDRGAHRQVESRRGGMHNGGGNKPHHSSSAGSGRGAPRRQGGGGGRGGDRAERAERAPKKEVNLDDDLDAYMAAR